MNDLLKISVVTVVYNAADSIVKTLQSVKEQTYKNIEFIVIDGGSQDATLSHIDSYADVISLLVSESDFGIYDAMNKGAALATGDYVTFLNAGDVYYSDSVLEDIFTMPGISNNDVVYGSNYYSVNNEMVLQKPRPLKLFYKGMPFNHQSSFVKTSVVKEYPFKNEVYRIQCEYHFLLSLYMNGYRFYCSPFIVATYEAGGYSDQNFLERTLESWLIIKRAGICDAKADAHYYGLVSQVMCGAKQVKIKRDWFLRLKKYLLYKRLD